MTPVKKLWAEHDEHIHKYKDTHIMFTSISLPVRTLISLTVDCVQPVKSIIVSTLHRTRTPGASGQDKISLAIAMLREAWMLYAYIKKKKISYTWRQQYYSLMKFLTNFLLHLLIYCHWEYNYWSIVDLFLGQWWLFIWVDYLSLTDQLLAKCKRSVAQP